MLFPLIEIFLGDHYLDDIRDILPVWFWSWRTHGIHKSSTIEISNHLTFPTFIFPSPQMNSLGSSSKWPSYDSLPSTSSFVFSESDQTEDEADIFSEGEGDSGGRKSLSADERIEFPQNASDFPAHSDRSHLRSKSDPTEHCPSETKHPDSASSPGAATLGSSAMTPGDLAFAHKVRTLKVIPSSFVSQIAGCSKACFLFILVRRFTPVYPSFAWASAWTEDRTIWQRYVAEQNQMGLLLSLFMHPGLTSTYLYVQMV